MSTYRCFLAFITLLTTLQPPLVTAHSWVEEYQVISPNGSFVGNRGYSRGYVSRQDPTYNGFSMMWMLPSLEARNDDGTVRNRIASSDLLCHPAQQSSNYTTTYPKLQVQPGDYVAMKYLENGHVSLPWNITGKPPGSGTVFVFGTTTPSNAEKIADVMQWNRKGTGGNKRGFLMTAQNFDDGRCHQLNCGSISQQRQMLVPNHVADQPSSTVESWCETDLKIPDDAKAGTLTTYWIWQWPTEPNMDCNSPAGKDEYYTTCADFDVVAATKADESNVGTHQKIAMAPFSAGPGANPQSIAVSDFKSRTAILTRPSANIVEHNKRIASTQTVAPAFVSSCSQQASVISANRLGLWPEVYVPNTCAVVSTFGTAVATAAAAVFAKAASSYAAGSRSAWDAAFAAAKLARPTPIPWSQYSSSGPLPTSDIAVPSITAVPSVRTLVTTTSMEKSSASTSKKNSQPDDTKYTTVTAIVVITSTLAPGEPIPTPTTRSEEVSTTLSSGMEASTTSNSTIRTLETAPDILSSSTATSSVTSTSSSSSPTTSSSSLSTSLTSSTSSPSSRPSPSTPPVSSYLTPSINQPPLIPTVNASGLVERHARQRRHARNFTPGT